MIMYSPKPSSSGDYVAAFDIAATLIIKSLIKKGVKFIRQILKQSKQVLEWQFVKQRHLVF